jgi:transposase-like protein
MQPPPDPHYRHRFPAEIISHAVWLYNVFSLSLRDVELLLAQRGVVVSYETVRRWCQKFGQAFADRLRRRRPRPGDKWHRDEVFIRLQGVQHYLWRAVDQDGVVLDILVQERRDAKAAKRFFRRLLKGLHYVPRVIVTDKLRSYGVAKRHLPGSSTDKAGISTIVPRTHIDRHGAENARCSGSSRWTRRKPSSPLTRSSIATSIHVGISWQLTHIVRSETRHLMSGIRRLAPSMRLDSCTATIQSSSSPVRS